MPFKLGKREHVPSPKDFKLSSYTTVLPKVPKTFGFGKIYTDWLMLGNGPDDSVEPGYNGAGDCVFAGADHETMMINKLAGHPVTFTGRNTIDDYSAVTGYVLDDESTDMGTYVRDAMSFRRKTGVIDASGVRHQIGAYVLIDVPSWEHLMQAVYIFGAVGMGFEFPASAWTQFDNGTIWQVKHGSQVVGGHYVPVVGTMDSATRATCITWARRQEFTKGFFETYADENWCYVSTEILRNGFGLHGVDVTTLAADLAAL